MSLVVKAQKAVDSLELLLEEPLNDWLTGQITRTLTSIKTDVISEQTYQIGRESISPKQKITVTDATIVSVKDDGGNFGGKCVGWQKILILDPKYGKIMFNTSQEWAYSAAKGDKITGTLRVKSVKDTLVFAQCKHRDMVLSHDSGQGVTFEACAG